MSFIKVEIFHILTGGSCSWNNSFRLTNRHEEPTNSIRYEKL